jgi:hypothetical protein
VKDKKYVVVFLTLLALALIATIYTIFVIYDIKIEARELIYYFVAACFITSVLYRLYEKRRKRKKIITYKLDQYSLKTKLEVK